VIGRSSGHTAVLRLDLVLQYGSSPLVRVEEDHPCCAPLEEHTQREGRLIAPGHIAEHPYAGWTQCKGALIEGHDQTDNLAKMLLGKLMLDNQPW
jgi:hypothetical protein